MKLLLINTPRSSHNALLDHASPAARPFIHRKLIGPPLGLLTVAAALKDTDEVFLLETKGEFDLQEKRPEEDRQTLRELVLEYLIKTTPDIVGVTFIASEFNAGIEIFKIVKAFDPQIVTIAGGLHTTLCPEDFSDDSVDIVCPGHAHKKIKDIVRALERKQRLREIKGIYLNQRGQLYYTGDGETVIDAAGDDFVMPDRSLLKRWISTYKVGKSTDPATYVFSSLGCPYKCTFCSIWPQYQGNYYPRKIESIVNELKTLDEYPIVRFADANSLVDEQFLNKLFDRIREEGIEKTYVMDMRVDSITKNPRLIEKLARGGLKVVITGFESFRNRELKAYNKSVESHLIEEAIKIFHNNDIMIRGNYVIPPDYDNDDFAALGEYASKNKVAYSGYTILSPMPGTLLHRKMQNQLVDQNLDKYNFFNCVLKTKLPLEDFYKRVADMWAIRRGTEVL
jgi:radical SAM superfamily enzyme YgiQ (UPF0313 family)